MKNFRVGLMFAVSLLAGLLAIVLAARWLHAQGARVTTRVVVAAVDLPLGTPLAPEHTRLVDWPSGAVPSGAFADPARLAARVLRTSVARDEPLLEAKLAPQGARGGLSAVISPGKRAISVRVNDVVGVAGFALPGNYVDVIVATRDERKSREDQSISRIVLEKILVLAVGDEVGRDDTAPKVVKAVTLEVTPAQAEVLDLARSVGQLSLVLRNQVDAAPVRTAGVTKDDLLGVRAIAPVASVASAPQRPGLARRAAGGCVEVFSGRGRSVQCF